MNNDGPQLPFDANADDDTEERDDAVIGVALRWSLIVFLLIAMIGGVATLVLTRSQPPPAETKSELAEVQIREAPQVQTPQVPFSDVTEAAGIHFKHENGARGRKLLPETMGGGCAFLDFDSDGDQDMLLVNSQCWEPDESTAPPEQSTMSLFRNDGTGKFADATAGSGLDVAFYGMGAAVGDYDNDGRPDVYLTAVGENRLFHNEGAGKFREVTKEAGVSGNAGDWSTSAGWLDYDNDGDLDLYVCNYVQWTREYDESQGFQLTGGGRAYGRPQNFNGSFPYLFRNDGAGRFKEVAESAGLQMRNPATNVPMGKSLGVTFADFDNDGWIDIIVANDTVQNFLFHNEGDGRFKEVGALTGVAFDSNGNARGAMGIDAARFRNNDAIGIAIGNFSNEMTALYVSQGDGMQFMDEAISTGLGPTTRLELTFGVFYFDYDLDGRLDLFAANGHLEEDINRVQPSQHYEQPPHLFWNSGHAQATEFLSVPADNCGPDLTKPMVGRGASFADIDGDGDLDVLITASGQSPRLLRNDQQQQHHWLRFKLTGRDCNRDAIGAWIEVELENQVLRRQVMPTRSYISQVELPLTFGLGHANQSRRVTIHWPDGSQQTLDQCEVDRTYNIVQSPDPSVSARPRELSFASAPRPRAATPWDVYDVAESMLPYDPPETTTSLAFASADRRRVSLVRGAASHSAQESTACGNYLSWEVAGRSGSRQRVTVPDYPCRGPACSKAPIKPYSPPANSLSTRPNRAPAAPIAPTAIEFTSPSDFVPIDAAGQPRHLGNEIFRPPRGRSARV